MIEVIKPPPPWSVEVSCPDCQARLKVEASDVKVGYFGPNWGGERPQRGLYFICPCCNDHVQFGDDVVIPRHVTRALLAENA